MGVNSRKFGKFLNKNESSIIEENSSKAKNSKSFKKFDTIRKIRSVFKPGGCMIKTENCCDSNNKQDFKVSKKASDFGVDHTF